MGGVSVSIGGLFQDYTTFPEFLINYGRFGLHREHHVRFAHVKHHVRSAHVMHHVRFAHVMLLGVILTLFGPNAQKVFFWYLWTYFLFSVHFQSCSRLPHITRDVDGWGGIAHG